jgi:large subunit ribosomal protein L9
MKVLLRKDVTGLGRRGDIVTVSSGHARNLLLPGGLAILATDGAVTQANSMRRARDLREAADRDSAFAVSAELAKHTITVKAKAGAEGRLFGSVKDQTSVVLDRKVVNIDTPIRTTGAHQVSVALFDGITGVVNLSVVAQ